MSVPKVLLVRRATELGTGFLAWKASDYAFDYLLYPAVIWNFGLLYGGVVMSALSLLSCLLLLRIYDHFERDWLGIEFVKAWRNYSGPSFIRRALAFMLSRSDTAACIVLSIYCDPFVTTAYLRKGSYCGMSRRDWIIFLVSWFIGNGSWIVVCYSGVAGLKWLTGMFG